MQRQFSDGDINVTAQMYGKGTVVYLLASAGREGSDFNELVIALDAAGDRAVAVEAPGTNGPSMIDRIDRLQQE